MSYLYLHETVHLLLTFVAAGITLLLLARKLKKHKQPHLTLIILLGAFIGEFLLDVDHLFDYFLAFGFSFNPGYFFSGIMFRKLQKVFVLFHAWEWIPLLGILIYITKKISVRYFLIALTLGLFFHLFYDTFSNNIFIGYSIIYRILHGFDINSISL